MSGRVRAATAVVVALLGLVGCSADEPELPPVELPAGTSGLVLTPDVASAGETLEVTFDPVQRRGAGYSMATGDGTVVYGLAVAYGGQGPTWWDAEEELPVGALGFEGPGPERLVVPDTAAAGDYLLCTWDPPEACAVLTVEPG